MFVVGKFLNQLEDRGHVWWRRLAEKAGWRGRVGYLHKSHSVLRNHLGAALCSIGVAYLGSVGWGFQERGGRIGFIYVCCKVSK